MTAPTTWVLSTTNTGKLAEFRELFRDTFVRFEALGETGVPAPEETGTTFVENALIKAKHAARLTGQPALADDSGLCVAALGGAPGVRSARFAGPDATDSDNVDRLLAELQALEDAPRDAAFHCVIVAVRSADDPAPLIASGRWPGQIAAGPRGNHGFGYDPVFLIPELGLTAAELEPARKNSISHRGRACRAFRDLLDGESIQD